MQKYFLWIIGLILLSACTNQQQESKTEKIHPVTIAVVEKQTWRKPIHASGVLSSKTEIKLSFKTGGIIESVNVSEGQFVRKNTRLASLNLSEIKAQVMKATLAKQKAERDFARVENLYKDSVATLEHLQDATTALEVAKATLDIALFNESHSIIEAPSNGKILMKLAEVHEIVAAGQPVLLFGSTDDDWVVKVHITDTEIIHLELGDKATIHFDAYPDVAFPAIVSETGKIADPYTGTYEVELTLKPGTYKLASGFIASADIYPDDLETGFIIPVDALTEANNRNGYLFVVEADSTVSRKMVQIAHIDQQLSISGGLKEGDLVVVDGAQYLKNGDRIHIVEPENK
jgi:membrane fusion protein, multidrug efflux system